MSSLLANLWISRPLWRTYGEWMTGKQAEVSVPVHELIANRWSPRSLDPAGTVPEPALRAMLEAARWAPSNGNTQPARYLVGRRGDHTYQRIYDTLRRNNQWWAGNAAVLLINCA